VVTSSGPGAAAAVDGVAHAHLDRAPVLVLTDRQPDRSNRAGFHQWLDQPRLFAGVVKASMTLTAEHAEETLRHAVALAQADPPGPVHVDVPVGLGRTSVPDAGPAAIAVPARPRVRLPDEVIERVREARWPVILAGLGARELDQGVLDEVASSLRAPVLATYKGKGAIDETSPWAAGILMAAGPEREMLERADLFVSVGLDAVELFPSVPDLAGRRIALDAYRPPPGVLAPPIHEVLGDLGHLVAGLPTSGSSQWDAAEVAESRRSLEARLAAAPSGEGGGLHPWTIATVLDEVCSVEADIAVDAGAHFLPVAQAWRTRRPGAFVISNGLATMGFGLPAATARSLAAPDRRVICCTGDGGLLMVAGELATAAREATRLTVVLFDDRSLSLIRIKQVGAEEGRGVDIDGPDWEAVGRGFGLGVTTVKDADQLRQALVETAESTTPELIVVITDPVPYRAIIEELRG
jgi:acetolactate synthase I/II/III large subunit